MTDTGEHDLQALYAVALDELLARPEAVARLAPIEHLMAQDIAREPRHMRCAGCLSLTRKLIDKMRGLT